MFRGIDSLCTSFMNALPKHLDSRVITYLLMQTLCEGRGASPPGKMCWT